MSESGDRKLLKGVSMIYPKISIAIQNINSAFLWIRRISIKNSTKLNAALMQTRVEHSHVCRISELHLDISNVPQKYSLHHVLEALNKNVMWEIEQERELWTFVVQIASALAYAHSKVGIT